MAALTFTPVQNKIAANVRYRPNARHLHNIENATLCHIVKPSSVKPSEGRKLSVTPHLPSTCRRKATRRLMAVRSANVNVGKPSLLSTPFCEAVELSLADASVWTIREGLKPLTGTLRLMASLLPFVFGVVCGDVASMPRANRLSVTGIRALPFVMASRRMRTSLVLLANARWRHFRLTDGLTPQGAILAGSACNALKRGGRLTSDGRRSCNKRETPSPTKCSPFAG